MITYNLEDTFHLLLQNINPSPIHNDCLSHGVIDVLTGKATGYEGKTILARGK